MEIKKIIGFMLILPLSLPLSIIVCGTLIPIIIISFPFILGACFIEEENVFEIYKYFFTDVILAILNLCFFNIF